MTDREKRIIKKLQAIIKGTPYEGEKATAMNVLRNYCKTQHINLDELSDDELNANEIKERYYEFVDNGYRGQLVTQVICRCMSEFGRPQREIRYGIRGKKKIYLIEVNSEEYLTIVTRCELYWKAYKEQLKQFNLAFLMKNHLLGEAPIDAPEPTEEELERYKKASLMSTFMDEVRDPNKHKRLLNDVKLLQ